MLASNFVIGPEGSQSATTVVVGVGYVVVTIFEKCLRLCQYAMDSYKTLHTHS